MNKLPRDFYLRSAVEAAPELLGKKLVHKTENGICSGMIVEVEAYSGAEDKGAHSYGNRRTPRTEIMFGEGGFSYVYSIYGMYYCFNVVVNRADKPECVFIRAVEPIDGIELMKARRSRENITDLCSGPGKLCAALGITKECYGLDLLGSELYIEEFKKIPKSQIRVSPRINIDYAEECADYYWRFFIGGNKFVSKVAKRFRNDRAFGS